MTGRVFRDGNEGMYDLRCKIDSDAIAIAPLRNANERMGQMNHVKFWEWEYFRSFHWLLK